MPDEDGVTWSASEDSTEALEGQPGDIFYAGGKRYVLQADGHLQRLETEDHEVGRDVDSD